MSDVSAMTRWQRIRYRALWVLHWLEWSPRWWRPVFPLGMVLAMTLVMAGTTLRSYLYLGVALVLGEILWRLFRYSDRRHEWKSAEYVTGKIPYVDMLSAMQVVSALHRAPQHRRFSINCWMKREVAAGRGEEGVNPEDPDVPPEVVALYEAAPPIEGPWWSPGEST